MKTVEVDIVKFDAAKGGLGKVRDYVAVERQFQILLNEKPYTIIPCSPDNLKELAIGHLLSEGVIKALEEIEGISINEATGVVQVKLKSHINIKSRLLPSERFFRVKKTVCGGSESQVPKRLFKVESKLMVKAETILNSAKNLSNIAETYRKTGGVHVAAIYKSDGLLVDFAEDVGRHNAVDKVIGKCVLANAELGKCFLTFSGRISSDIVFKAARMRMPIVVSISAALSSGIEAARITNITLVGFARGNRMNVYNAAERIIS
ncbi:MAG: formate dehydrogenase accessory sulfurtransferase FdhD [Candidatus Bathyarchaeia archaeon]